MGDPVSDDAARVVSSLDLQERVRLLSGRDAWHLEAVGDLPAWTLTDGPHGVRHKVGDGGDLRIADVEPATCFPPAVTLACTFDESLLAEVGHALGREAAAAGVGVLLGPGLNLVRHPAGGRTFEYLGEDPLVAGRLAAALVRGIQAQGVGACVKHLAANHQESGRMHVDTIVDPRTLHELELRAFELAITGGRPWTVMHAYNRLNGVPTGEDRWLLTDVLRERWGSDALVMSDWGAVADRVASIAAGTDLEMPGGTGLWDDEVLGAVADGRLDPDAVAACATRVVGLSQRLAATAPQRADAEVDADAHHALARRVAAAGTVLLTNDGTLPLRAQARVGIVGAFAKQPRYQGAGSSQVRPTRLDDLWTQLSTAHDGSSRFAAGYDAATGAASAAQVAEAVALAAEVDVVVAHVGLPAAAESEGFDRPHLRLPEGQTALLEALLGTDTPVVVVLAAGGPLELPWADRAAAVVAAHLGGQAGGAALADVLRGEVDPGGRLACSYPVAVEDLAAHAWFGDRRQVQHREGLGVGYRFHDTAQVPARFPFGHGLSYASFDLGVPQVAGRGAERSVTTTVTNTGGRPGRCVVQCYVAALDPAMPRPAQELRAFAAVELAPGERAQVHLDLDRRAFAVWDVGRDGWAVPAGGYELRIARSSTDVHAVRRITIEDGEVLAPSVTPVVAAADEAGFAAALGREVPAPDPVTPFHRSTTVAELGATRRGRLVQRMLLAQAGRQADELGGDDEASRRMLEAVLAELPLRTVAVFSGGRLSLSALDALLRALNLGRRDARARRRSAAD